MSAGPFAKVNPGDPVPSSMRTWNGILDAARANREQHESGGSLPDGIFRQTGIIKVRNITGGDLERFSVVELKAPAIDPADNSLEIENQVVMDGDIPSDDDTVCFGVLIDPSGSGSIGRAVISGVSVCWLHISDMEHRTCSPVPGDTDHMESLAEGGAADILWASPTPGGFVGVLDDVEETSSYHLAYVLLRGCSRPPPVALVKITSLTRTKGLLPGVIAYYQEPTTTTTTSTTTTATATSTTTTAGPTTTSTTSTTTTTPCPGAARYPITGLTCWLAIDDDDSGRHIEVGDIHAALHVGSYGGVPLYVKSDSTACGKSTTSTPPRPCGGSCKWQCDEGQWALVSDTCECGACAEPIYCCGDGGCGDDDEKTSSGCLPAGAIPNLQPDCTSTTSTTTPYPDFCGHCTWRCVGGGWVLLDMTCTVNTLCFGQCPPPDGVTTPCTPGMACFDEKTWCWSRDPRGGGGGGGDGGSPCGGVCCWMWGGDDVGWFGIDKGIACRGYGPPGCIGDCRCDRPTFPGGECGQSECVPCYFQVTGATDPDLCGSFGGPYP